MNLWKGYYYSHIIGEEADTERLSFSFKITQQLLSKKKIQFQISDSKPCIYNRYDLIY